MKINLSFITLHDLVFFAHHGVSDQERRIGNHFTVNLRLKTNITRAAATDNVADTINYADVYQAVKDEMQTPSNLLEHAAARIAQRLLNDFPKIIQVKLRLTKINPPMGAETGGASVEIICNR
jgi:dihydroneopterin aldolase